MVGGGCGTACGKSTVDGLGVTIGILFTSKSGDVAAVVGVGMPLLDVGCGCLNEAIYSNKVGDGDLVLE
jgi:hypothetical protein